MFIVSLDVYFFGTYYTLGTVLGARGRVVNRMGKRLTLLESTF